jgi:hypothetical protein
MSSWFVSVGIKKNNRSFSLYASEAIQTMGYLPTLQGVKGKPVFHP